MQLESMCISNARVVWIAPTNAFQIDFKIPSGLIGNFVNQSETQKFPKTDCP